MTISSESKPAPAEHTEDGFTTCIIDGDAQVAIPPQSKKFYCSGVMNQFAKAERKTGSAGMLQRRRLIAGYPFIFLGITLAALAIGILGFFTAGKSNLRARESAVFEIADLRIVVTVGIQSAVSKDAASTQDHGQMAGRAILDASVTPFATTGTATESFNSVTGVVNGTLSVASVASTISEAGASTASS